MKKNNINLHNRRGILQIGIWILSLLMLGSNAKAQQEPAFTQYMFNTQTINPAYTGTWEAMGFLLLAREQWAGIKGAPSTQNFSFQSPIRQGKVALGLDVVNDNFGLEKRLNVSGNYSFKVQLSENLNLRMGLKLGISHYSNNLSDYDIIEKNDPRFQGQIEPQIMPNFGVGLFLYHENYYMGLSVPRIIKNEFGNNSNNLSTQAEINHFYLTGGYVFDLSEKLKFKPTFLAKVASGAPAQMDISANFLIFDKVWLGSMIRTGDSYGFIAQWIIDKKLRIGYAVDFATTQIRNYQNGSHEVMISYELKLNKEKMLSQRLY